MPDTDALDVADMQATANGDRAAFDRILLRHQNFLVNFFRRLGACQGMAEDLAQETFVRLYKWRARYQPTARFVTFLFTLARHAWADSLRMRGRRIVMATEWDPDVHDPGRDDSARQDLHLDMQDALLQLEEGQRMVVLLNTFEGLNYAEIGAVLGIPEGTVKSRMFHAMRKLRAYLADKGYDDEHANNLSTTP